MKFFDIEVAQRAVCDGCSKRTWCGAWCQMLRCGTITVDREEEERANIDLHYSCLARTISLCDDCKPRVENFPAIWCRAVDWEIVAARPLISPTRSKARRDRNRDGGIIFDCETTAEYNEDQKSLVKEETTKWFVGET